MKHYLGICLVLVTLAAIILFTLHACTSAVDRSVNNVRDAFEQVFKIQPEVTVNQRVILTQTAPISELAVVTKEELISSGYTQHMELLSYQVPMTEKTLSAEASYRIKAGFDFQEPFRVTIDPATHQVHATLPHAKILSVEQLGDLILKGEDSALNRISDDERAKLLNGLDTLARQQAEASSLKKEAEDQVTARLQDLLARNGEKVSTVWTAQVPPKP